MADMQTYEEQEKKRVKSASTTRSDDGTGLNNQQRRDAAVMTQELSRPGGQARIEKRYGENALSTEAGQEAARRKARADKSRQEIQAALQARADHQRESAQSSRPDKARTTDAQRKAQERMKTLHQEQSKHEQNRSNDRGLSR